MREDNRRFADAKPLELTRRHDTRVPAATARAEPVAPRVSFLEAAERMRRAKWDEDPIQVADRAVQGRERQ